MAKKQVLGLFPEAASAALGCDRLKEAGFGADSFQVLTGTPYPEGAFGERAEHHRLYIFPFVGALLGLTSGILLTSMTQMAYPLVQGGKPILSLPPMAIVTYEGTMLGAILFTVLGIIFESRLPNLNAGIYDPRITAGYIGITLTVPEERLNAVEQLLRRAGAADVKVER